eukprot:gene14638-18701_t
MGIEAISAEDGGCVLALPYSPELVGDPDSGVLHGGAVTALIDTAFGFAVYFRIQQFQPMATLDLRIDYLRPAKPGVKVHTQALCYKVTPELAFVRGCSYEEDAGDPFASCVGVFMFTAGQRLAQTVADIRQHGDWSRLPQVIPFARMLKLRVDVRGESFTSVLPYEPSLIGNPMVPALHGG